MSVEIPETIDLVHFDNIFLKFEKAIQNNDIPKRSVAKYKQSTKSKIFMCICICINTIFG
ncbi:095L [Cherax quadricarinatus iridovirus]|uniref:095L n=1 Tax=Cherax quadricarinatus iridovirus TaxID=2035708 RepID=UPI000BBFAED1|nr:095L [Cherax quadricarinatus iridovirus]ASZ85075.1 095L [Cherax quadricarinatus iridovirus]